MMEKHTIILIPFEEKEKRKQLWSVINFDEEIEGSYKEIDQF